MTDEIIPIFEKLEHGCLLHVQRTFERGNRTASQKAMDEILAWYHAERELQDIRPTRIGDRFYPVFTLEELPAKEGQRPTDMITGTFWANPMTYAGGAA